MQHDFGDLLRHFEDGDVFADAGTGRCWLEQYSGHTKTVGGQGMGGVCRINSIARYVAISSMLSSVSRNIHKHVVFVHNRESLFAIDEPVLGWNLLTGIHRSRRLSC